MLRLLRNEPVDDLSREVSVPIDKLEQFNNLADVGVAVAEFKERYNCHWRLEKTGFMSPLEARQAYAMRKTA